MVPSNLPISRVLLLIVVLLSQRQASSSSSTNDDEHGERPRPPPPKFGHDLGRRQFLLNYTNFNHGSFGACPRYVLDYQTALRHIQEQQPDPFIRATAREMWNATRHRVAGALDLRAGGPTSRRRRRRRGLVLLESASAAVNGILRSMSWEEGDIILYFSTSYGMVKNTAKWLERMHGIRIVEVPITFPIIATTTTTTGDGADRAYLDPLQATLEGLQRNGSSSITCPCRRLRMAVLDHIVSIPAVVLPVAKMTEMIRSYTNAASASVEPRVGGSGGDPRPCSGTSGNNGRRGGTFILVDGAHAWGQVPSAEISGLLNHGDDSDDDDGDDGDDSDGTAWDGIDAYLSNGHKWMYSPKGSAILWVRPSRIDGLFPEPTIISSENSMGQEALVLHPEGGNGYVIGNNDYDYDDPMAHRYAYTGTRDYTPMLSLSRAMDFQQWLGGEEAIHGYVRGLAVQAKRYLSALWKTVPLVPDSMEIFMVNVIIPIDRDAKNATDVATGLQRWLLDERDMYVVIAKEPSSGYIFTRLSAQVYLEMGDFERLGDAVLEYLSSWSGGDEATTTSGLRNGDPVGTLA